jgi:hypothetical protein
VRWLIYCVPCSKDTAGALLVPHCFLWTPPQILSVRHCSPPYNLTSSSSICSRLTASLQTLPRKHIIRTIIKDMVQCPAIIPYTDKIKQEFSKAEYISINYYSHTHITMKGSKSSPTWQHQGTQHVKMSSTIHTNTEKIK